MRLVHFTAEGQSARWGVVDDCDTVRPLMVTLGDLLRVPVGDALASMRLACPDDPAIKADDVTLLAPVDDQEVWASGVTYRRSLDARGEESTHASLYDHVYSSPRPELFLKATPGRVVGPGDPVGIRLDSAWNVPEPELALVLNSRLELFGLTIGNDMSSRSIEGENALFLPQAKFYDRSCAIGPQIVLAGTHQAPFDIQLRVERDDGVVLEEKTSTSQMTRSFDELASWLGRATSFPNGVVLLTGTGIVPRADFTLHEDDLIRIRVDGLGELMNPVTAVGTND